MFQTRQVMILITVGRDRSSAESQNVEEKYQLVGQVGVIALIKA